MKAIILGTAVLATVANAQTSAVNSRYCALITSQEASGATGWYNLQIDSNGQGSHSLELDLSGFTSLPGTCDLSAGLTYHIHSFWDDSTGKLSGANAECGLAYTGNHYDPYLACGPNTEETTACTALGRTATSVPPYTYPCSSTQYAAGQYEYCEVGDTSGKFGKLFQVNGKFSASVADPSPALIPAYATASQLAHQWVSLVVHCGSSRILCAKYLPVSSSASCGTYSAASSSDNSDSNDLRDLSTPAGATLWAFIVVAGFGLGALVGYKLRGCFGEKKDEEKLMGYNV